GVRNCGGSYGLFLRYFHACFSPNKSKWSISKVQVKSKSQPAQKSACNIFTAVGSLTVQTTPGSGCQNSTTVRSSRLAINTYVLRSNKCGTNLVHARLKPCRAIPLCCTANAASNAALISSAWLSVDCGSRTSMVQTNQIARRNTPRKIP